MILKLVTAFSKATLCLTAAGILIAVTVAIATALQGILLGMHPLGTVLIVVTLYFFALEYLDA